MKELVSKYSIRIKLFTAFSFLVSVIYITMHVTSSFERMAAVVEGNNIDIEKLNTIVLGIDKRVDNLEVLSATFAAQIEYLTKK